MKSCIILPTFNESEQLPRLVRMLRLVGRDYPIIIVDDNSPDGTGAVADALAQEFRDIRVVHRQGKNGIGSALRDGFRIALENGFDYVITMNADFSHPPAYIKKFLKHARHYDLLIGSRYISGVRVEGWRFRQLVASKFANMFIAYLMVKPIWDFSSGFRVYSADFLRQTDLDALPDSGHLFQVHMIHAAYALRARVKEIPFVFRASESNDSGFGWRERLSTLSKITRYRAPLLEILRHLTFLRKDYKRFVAEYEELLSPTRFKNDGSFGIPESFEVSVGVMAYNEEKNIAVCLEALQGQQMQSGRITQIVVVSSGSTDRTDEIVREMAAADERILLVVEKDRRGKASAINEYLKVATGDILVLESADTITEPDTIEHLINPFFDPEVGTNGAHPIPVNPENTFIGFCVNKLWALHHHIAMEHPKCGELIAFRNIIPSIPFFTAVDEAIIEAIFREKGLKICYAPEALVRNKGPETLHDFVKQRRRIAVGHKHLLATTGYQVATFRSSSIFRYILKEMRWTPREVLYMTGLIAVEAYCRVAGTINFHLFDKNPFVWSISTTTKNFDNMPRDGRETPANAGASTQETAGSTSVSSQP
ncbi:MAG TPA: glycosyltransferase [Calditrichia bacterium]|nr:glycosyltransferase [Calditrichia bacterium]HQV30484.1 glycosyltransferase [Calditrichia bacterium]